MAAGRGLMCVGVVAVLAGSASAFNAAPVRAVAASLPPISFSVPTIADAVHTYGEPDINLAQGDNVYVSGPTGTGTQRSLWSGSFDAQAYRLVNQNAAVGPFPLAGINSPPGGGDTEIVFDNGPLAGHANQGQYFSDLYALLCFRVEATHDGGATVTQNAAPGTAGCASQQPTADRQWQAVFDPPAGVTSTSPYMGTKPLVYLTYNAGAAAWNKSTDGTTYTPADGATPSTPNLHFGNDGYPAIDQVTGKVFEAAGDGNGALKMNIGSPLATGDLCFLDDTATSHAPCPKGSGLVTVATGLTGDPNSHFPVLTMDKARNLYLSWNQVATDISKDQVYITAAPANNAAAVNGCTTNCWNNWTTPVKVSDGLASTGDVVNSFSWSASGGTQGIADIAWYGSNKADDPNTNNCGTDLHSPTCEVWNLFFNQVQFQTNQAGAVTGPPATTPTPVVASPHPMHYGDICGAGLGCVAQQGNRNLADFFMVRADSTGAAEIVYDDTSNGLLTAGAPPSNQTADHAGAPVVTVIRQNAGRGVFGTAVPGSPVNAPAPVPSVTPTDHLDGAQTNAVFSTTSGAIAGTHVPGMDLTRSQLSLTGSTLTVTMKVADLTDGTVASTIPGTTLQQYVTRWVMATTDPQRPYEIFYAGMSCVPGTCTQSQAFYAGPAQSTDLCSVSACFPHVTLYPESTAVGTPASGVTAGHPEFGGVSCPATPSATNPCAVTVNVNTADIGSPTDSSLLEEVGAYSFAASHPQAATTVPLAQADSVHLMVDGVCCYNFQGTPAVGAAESPLTPALLLAGAAMVAGGVIRRRRRSERSLGEEPSA